MRLLNLELSDFRSFFGVHKIEFSAENARRVTLFHGENGAGKTNLLNAIHWCITGKFTPRFEDQRLLVNKEAKKAGRRSCYVELVFVDEESSEGKQYRVHRAATDESETEFSVYEIQRGNSRLMAKGESFLRMLLPPGLISWFFFDAEAIGALELSGSAEFKRDLRKTLGFDLVDTLLQDLEGVHAKRRRELASQTNDKELQLIQADIEDIDRILPNQIETARTLEAESKALEQQYESVRLKLQNLPQAAPIEKRRLEVERGATRIRSEKSELTAKASQMVGQAAPALLLLDITAHLEGKLEQREVRGKLPAPFSDQLVKDIVADGLCICGRPVLEGSPESHKIHDLLKFAATGALNQRISEVRYMIRDIERQAREYPVEIAGVRSRISNFDSELGLLEEEQIELTKKLSKINLSEIQMLERERERLEKERAAKWLLSGKVSQLIEQNERKKRELQARYDAVLKKLDVSKKLRTEADKVARLMEFIKRSLHDQEKQALLILSHELNDVLRQYLTKHYRATIDPTTYAVRLQDSDGNRVGHSTGEGQVLKFAFIATVVALAAKKTQQKIKWMSDPTIAPLVLDAPFSALDPEYQGSVARNLSFQATQLILMISSAAWGEKVAGALESVTGKRYLIVSHETGPRGEKPVKTLMLNGVELTLNYYDAPRTESTFVEVA
jgi:DNA sulfur modification protein DndD